MITQEKLVSVGMPTFNRAAYIAKALDSLLAQTYANFELIISDNASTDETERICRGYVKKDKRIHYIRQEKNRGPIANFNIVLDEAVGDYFMWASDDDWWDKTFIEKCLKKFHEDPKAVMVAPAYVGVNERGEVVHRYRHEDYFPLDADPYTRLKTYLLHQGGEKANLLYAMWRRDVLVRNRTNFHPGWEKSYILRNVARGNCYFIDETLFFKRATPRDHFAGKSLLVTSFGTVLMRVQKIGSPYLFNYLRAIFSAEGLAVAERLKLVLCVFIIFGRLITFRRA